VARIGENISAYGFLVRKPEVKRLLARPRRRWEDMLNGFLRNRMRSMDWNYLA
jgi:hypothetical protein